MSNLILLLICIYFRQCHYLLLYAYYCLFQALSLFNCSFLTHLRVHFRIRDAVSHVHLQLANDIIGNVQSTHRLLEVLGEDIESV